MAPFRARQATTQRFVRRRARTALLTAAVTMLIVLPSLIEIPDAAASSVSSVSVSPSPATAGSRATYTVDLTVTTALSGGSGSITLDASSGASGTRFPCSASSYVITDETTSSGSGGVSATPTCQDSDATVTFAVPRGVRAPRAAGAQLRQPRSN